MQKPADPDPEGVRAIAALPSLGLPSARMLRDAGVGDPEDLRALGPVEAWRRLRFQFGRRITVNWIYALECALHGLRWRELPPTRMAELKSAAEAVAAELAEAAGPARRPRRIKRS